jgi:hypothetical protein
MGKRRAKKGGQKIEQNGAQSGDLMRAKGDNKSGQKGGEKGKIGTTGGQNKKGGKGRGPMDTN